MANSQVTNISIAPIPLPVNGVQERPFAPQPVIHMASIDTGSIATGQPCDTTALRKSTTRVRTALKKCDTTAITTHFTNCRKSISALSVLMDHNKKQSLLNAELVNVLSNHTEYAELVEQKKRSIEDNAATIDSLKRKRDEMEREIQSIKEYINQF